MKILQLIFFSFILSGLIFTPTNVELSIEENENLVNGRIGPDAEVVSILSPRATTMDSMTGEMLNTLFAGDDVNFDAFISNAGDETITEMEITVTVYNSNGGARGTIAQDAAGIDLSWTNSDVICDDAFVCPWSSLDVGANLANGKYTMTYQGSVVTWNPTIGDYVVVVETNALGDSSPANDYSENLVSVVDWTDIIVDLAWDSGKETEGGSGDKAFTLTVSTGGSSTWSARSVTLDMTVTGALDSALDSAGADILGTNIVSDFGTGATTETFRHQDNANNSTSAMRYVLAFESETTWNGVISPSTQVETGDYSVEVNLVSYVLYGQQPDCVEEVISRGTGPNGGDQTFTYYHYCEVTKYSDDVSSTSEAEIEGKVQNFHDIGISNLVVNQGHTVDENGAATSEPTMPGMTSGPLEPAWSSVQASVRHLGNNMMETYDWEVNFEIENTVTGVTHTETADSCLFGFGEAYTHLELGEDPMGGTAFEMGEACIMFEFTPGIYNITATVSMINIDQEDDGTGTMVDAYADMSARNDDSNINEIYAFNFRPEVELSLDTSGEIIIGPEGVISLSANAYDPNDQGGLALTYLWSHPGLPEGENGTVIPSPCNGVGPAYSTCQLIALDADWAGVRTYSVSVTDNYGSSSIDFLNLLVWNHVITTSTTASGIEMVYDLTYDGANAFSVSLTDSSEGPYTQDLTNFGYAGEYTSVAVLDYAPSTTYMPEDVYAQSITMNYDASTLAPTSAFWISNGNWAQLDTSISAAGSDGTISIDMGQNGVLPQGEIVLMGGELQIIDGPNAYPYQLQVYPSSGGNIEASWSYVGTTIPGFDWLSMQICDSNGDCDTTLENVTLMSHTLNGQTDTVHGVTYTYTLAVCNAAGCNPITATASAVADHQLVNGNDADDDGVSNNNDDCPGTPNGITVDENGCPIDFDNDGVSYLEDDCPGTPEGVNVDTNGCAIDSDQDGIPDYVDDCPQTISGFIVDENGCAIDPDQDGYANSVDDCPNIAGTSSKGQHTTKLIGCIDTDGDGWADTIDAFPSDETEWLDSDGDGCGDNSDAFPQDPDECLDTDEDGFGDNIDVFPEDPMEFEDKDNDGIGDTSDKCDTTSTGKDVDSTGCEIEDETSALVIGLISGVGGLLLVIIGLLVIMMRKGTNKPRDNSISVYHDDSLFDDSMIPDVGIPSNNVPLITDQGKVGSDGYEWLEKPAGSGNWYWRQNAGTQWTKHQ